MPVSISRVCWNRLSTASLEGKWVNVRQSNQNKMETTTFSLHIAKNVTLRSAHIFSYKIKDVIYQKIQKIQYRTFTIQYRVEKLLNSWSLSCFGSLGAASMLSTLKRSVIKALWVLALQHVWLSIFAKFQRSMTAHDTGGMPMKSAITVGKYTEFLCVNPSIHPIFWSLPSLLTRYNE